MTAPSAFARELGLRYPIVQGPMNGASPPAALFSPAVILERVQQIRAQTTAPFNINLFLLDEQHPDLAELKRAQHLLRPFREALGLSEPPIPTQFAENNRDQIAALLEAAPPVASFTFGVLPLYDVERCYLCQASLQERGLSQVTDWVLDAEVLAPDELRRELAGYDAVMTF